VRYQGQSRRPRGAARDKGIDMTSGLIALVASALLISGVIIGWRLSQWRLAARAKRQAAAQLSLYRQLHELQEARKEAASKADDLAVEFRRRAA
jgi:hypothetical protein